MVHVGWLARAGNKWLLACRREMGDMMHRLIDSFLPVYLQPMTLSELYQRMCMNLVHQSAVA